MGHIHLGVLPRTKKWDAVVRLLDDHAPTDDVIVAAGDAAEADLLRAADDQLFVETVRLLANVPLAAREADFGRALQNLGIATGAELSISGLIASLGDRLDQYSDQLPRRTDFAELSRRALISTLWEQIGGALPGLFEATPADVQAAARRLAHPRAFSALARDYFTVLLSQTLRYWLDRTLSTQVGPGKRFKHIGERRAFDDALTQYCREATRIIQEFAAGWFGKTLMLEGRIEARHAATFGAVAFKKIGEEIRYKREAHA
jgi:hypothetical protein